MSPDDNSILTPPDPAWAPFGAERAALAEFVALTRRKRELESELEDEINPKLKTLSQSLIDYLADCGDVPPHVDGFTVYLQSQLWARKPKGVTMQEVCAVLKATDGWTQFVKEEYSTSSLSSHIRGLVEKYAPELETGEIASISELLPEPLRPLLTVEPTYSVIAREIERKK